MATAKSKRTPAPAPHGPRRPLRLAMVMSDHTIEPVDLDDEGADLRTLDLDDPSDRQALIDAVRAALRRFA